MTELISLIKARQDISKNKVNLIQITGDGNCLYRAFSYFLYGNENEHINIRKEVYEKAKIRKNELKNFFLENIDDEILLNTRIDNYLEKIKENGFYGGTIELGILSNSYQLNISVYETDINDNLSYKHYINIWHDEFNNNFILLHYDKYMSILIF